MHDDTDDDGDDDASESGGGYVLVGEALEASGWTLQQLRALVQAGCVGKKVVSGKTYYASADIERLQGTAKGASGDDADADVPSSIVRDFRELADGYKSMLDLALKQTRQAQEHERLLITAFSKPLENLGESSKALVGAVLGQNEQLVKRASDGDAARLEFVQAAEVMLRDQRSELRETVEAERKHALKLEVWEGVKKAAPHLLEGLKLTASGGSEALEAAQKLKTKLNPDKVASLVAFNLLDSEELDLLCKAFGYDRADLERRAREASEVKSETEPQAAE